MRFFRRRGLAQRLAQWSQTIPQQPLCRVHIDRGSIFIVQMRPHQVAEHWAERLLQEQRQQVISALKVSPELVHEVLVISADQGAVTAPNMCYLDELDNFLAAYSMPLFDASQVKRLIHQWQLQQTHCEQCNTPMHLLIRQQGRFAGTAYFSCRDFPRCRQLKPAN